MRRPMTWLIAGGLLAAPALAPAADNNLEITAEAALEIDVLLAIDLPLVTYEARSSGIAEEEIEVALSSARDGGVSAASTAEIVTAEVDETKKAGEPKKNFGQWVRQQVAAGVKGRALAEAIRERKAELAQSSETDEEIDAKLAKQKKERKAYRAKLRKKRKELVASGKKAKVRGKAKHAARKRALASVRSELLRPGKVRGAPARAQDRGMPGHTARPAAHVKPRIDKRDRGAKRAAKVDSKGDKQGARAAAPKKAKREAAGSGSKGQDRQNNGNKGASKGK